jgi:chaperonin GroEL
MTKKTISGDESRAAILRGVNSLADAVTVTFGPRGKNVVLGRKTGSPEITRDGGTVAREIELADRFENMAAQLFKEAASKTVDEVGGGATTATVLARAMFREGLKLIAAGANPNGLRRGIERAVEVAVDCLQDDATDFRAGVSDAAELSGLPTLKEVLNEEKLAPEDVALFERENAKLESEGDLPVVSRLLLAATATGFDDAMAYRIAARVLQAQSDLNDKFDELNKQITTLASMTADDDEQLGALISEAIRRVGNEGVVTVEESKGLESAVEVIEGMQFDRGYLSPYFVTDVERAEAILDDPYILIYDKQITSLSQILPVLESVSAANKPLLIIAENVDGEALATLVVNKLRGNLNAVAVKAPAFGDRRREILEDIAVVTGGKVIAEELGQKLEKATIDELGGATKVVVDKDNTIIVGGRGQQSAIAARAETVRKQINDTDSEYDREKLQERLGKLTGGVAVIKLGAITETELKIKKKQLEDALQATRAAIAEGVVPGGGVALIRCINRLDQLHLKDDEAFGVTIVKRALEEPIRLIAKNAGYEGGVVLDRVRHLEDHNFGFDASAGTYTNLVKAGVFDPVKVTRLALQNAASVAGMMLSTEGMIAHTENESLTA